jgi:hypothetical protein
MRSPRDPISVDFKTAKVYDTGGQLMISGPNEADVKEALEMLVKEDGARTVAAPAQVGSKWVAACTHPIHTSEECEVRREGWKIVIAGPSEQAVALRTEQLKERGALIVEPPYQQDGHWVAVLDEGGLQDLMHFD